MSRTLVAIAVGLLALSLGGCQSLDVADAAESKLLDGGGATPVSDQRVALEVFFVHLPLGDRQTSAEIWQSVDEQGLPAGVRRTLSQHGFRVGVCGSELPRAVQDLLAASANATAANQSDPETAGTQPMATRQELRLRPGSRGEIVPSPIHDRLTVISCDDREITGKTYHTAQGRFAIRCNPQGDGRAEIEIVPQLFHGQPQRRFVGEDGLLRFETGQPKVVFEALEMTPTLSPGQMLLIGCEQDPITSLGRDFLCDTTTGKPVQKLLIIRLVQSAYDDALAASL